MRASWLLATVCCACQLAPSTGASDKSVPHQRRRAITATSGAPARAVGRARGAAPRPTLNVLDFGAAGDGVADDAPAIQRGIDQAQYENRALYVPAGIYRINRGLVVNTTEHAAGKYSPSTNHWAVAPLRLLGEGATNGEGQSVIFAGAPMSAVLTYASRAPGLNSSADNTANMTMNHALEQITLDANDLANFSAYAPAIFGCDPAAEQSSTKFSSTVHSAQCCKTLIAIDFGFA